MNCHIVAHSADPDGVIAHSLLERALSRDNEVHHQFVDYPNFVGALEQLVDLPGGKVIVADMALNDSYKKSDLFSRVKGKHGSLTWYDHHEGSITGKSFLEQYCDRIIVAPNKCAAWLVQQDLLPNDDYAAFLADIAQTHDFQKQEPLLEIGNQLQDVISSGDDLLRLVGDLASGSAWEGEMLTGHYFNISLLFRQKKQQALFDLDNSMEYDIIAGKNVIFAYADRVLYMKDALEHIKRTQPMDYIFVLYEGISNVILEGKGNIGTTAVDFCKRMGGGGRGHGGGFDVGHPVRRETYGQDKGLIRKRFLEYLSSQK